MNLLVVQRTLGILLLLFAVTMLPPLVVSFLFHDGNWAPFTGSFIAIALAGAVCWWPARNARRDMRLRDGMLIVSLFWVVLGGAGAAPFLLSEAPRMSFTDAVFEAVSGFTTTGATVLSGLDTMSPSFLYYRQQIHWFGGMGIVVLAVAILPMLGVGGLQLVKAESPGPVKDAKLSPRIIQTAKALWGVYVVLTAVCTVAYWLAGMSLFDALGHAYSTISTGGFSTHDMSIAFYESGPIEVIAMIFMFLGGANFALHFLAWRGRGVGTYLRDPEFRAYTGILATLIAFYAVTLWLSGTEDGVGTSLMASAFQAISIQTSTGFLTEDFSLWPGAIPAMLIMSTFLGGCAGSTGGGMKVVRWLLIGKQIGHEVRQLVHPRAVMSLKLGQRTVDGNVLGAVRAFVTLYFALLIVLSLLLLSTGVDVTTAFSAIATCMSNTGPGLGDVVWTFATLSTAGKWISVLAMLLGRLEIFPLFLLIVPEFWRR
jgi:trk system potassium uptake protein